MKKKPYLMVGSSLSSTKTIIIYTRIDLEYSLEDYLLALAAYLFTHIG